MLVSHVKHYLQPPFRFYHRMLYGFTEPFYCRNGAYNVQYLDTMGGV